MTTLPRVRVNNASVVYDRPSAEPPLISFRIRGPVGWIMIAADGRANAFTQAQRTGLKIDRADLQVWHKRKGCYVKC